MGTTQAVVARLESGETMASASTLSASPGRPVSACGFGLSRRSRASPRRRSPHENEPLTIPLAAKASKIPSNLEFSGFRGQFCTKVMQRKNSYFSMANFCCENLEFRNSDGSFLPGTGTLIFLRTFNAEAFAQSQHVLKVFLAKLIAGVKLHQLVG